MTPLSTCNTLSSLCTFLEQQRDLRHFIGIWIDLLHHPGIKERLASDYTNYHCFGLLMRRVDSFIVDIHRAMSRYHFSILTSEQQKEYNQLLTLFKGSIDLQRSFLACVTENRPELLLRIPIISEKTPVQKKVSFQEGQLFWYNPNESEPLGS